MNAVTGSPAPRRTSSCCSRRASCRCAASCEKGAFTWAKERARGRSCARGSHGQIRKTEHDTVIEIAIGPNRVAGVFLTVLATLLGTAAVLATFLAWSSPYGTWSAAAISWVILAAFIAVFFVFPAGDHPRERAFLLAHVEKTLEAAPIPALISPRKSSG